MRLIGIATVLLFVLVAGFGAWLYIEDDQRTISRVDLPTNVSREASRNAGSDGRVPLSPIDPAMLEPSPHGPLPHAAGGREPWRYYGRRFTIQEGRPRIAIVIVGLGLDRSGTDMAIDELPPEVTLAFSPYGNDLTNDAQRARSKGHEILVSLPIAVPENEQVDMGNHALRPAMGAEEMQRELYWTLGRFAGYVGVLVRAPGPLLARDQIGQVFSELGRRGLIFVDARPISAGAIPRAANAGRLVHARATAWLDADPAPTAIDAQMSRTKSIAQASGLALVVGQPYPVTLRRVQQWIDELERDGFAIAPVTGVVNVRSGQ